MTEVGRGIKDHLVPARCHTQAIGRDTSCYTRFPQCPIQPGLECLQGWGIHTFTGQPAPVPHCSDLVKKFPTTSTLNLPTFSLKLFPSVLSLSDQAEDDELVMPRELKFKTSFSSKLIQIMKFHPPLCNCSKIRALLLSHFAADPHTFSGERLHSTHNQRLSLRFCKYLKIRQKGGARRKAAPGL